MRSLQINKLRTETSQNTAELYYKIDTCSDRNLMPISMFKTPFPGTPNYRIKKYINKKFRLHAYNNSRNTTF